MDSRNSYYSGERYSEEKRRQKRHKHSSGSRSTSLSKSTLAEYKNKWKESSGQILNCSSSSQGVDSNLSRSSHGKSTFVSVDSSNHASASNIVVKSFPASSHTLNEQSESINKDLGDVLHRNKSTNATVDYYANAGESKSKNAAGNRQSLEELESFLANLKATKLAKPTTSRKGP